MFEDVVKMLLVIKKNKNNKLTYSKQFVQEAVLQCVQRLSEQQPDVQVGLITFNHQVYA